MNTIIYTYRLSIKPGYGDFIWDRFETETLAAYLTACRSLHYCNTLFNLGATTIEQWVDLLKIQMHVPLPANICEKIFPLLDAANRRLLSSTTLELNKASYAEAMKIIEATV